MAAKLGGGHERLPIERDRSIWVPLHHSGVEENEAMALAEPGDLVADLSGPSHVVVPDGP
jgi:hypothetical protein